jgi:hypothetical protein
MVNDEWEEAEVRRQESEVRRQKDKSRLQGTGGMVNSEW